MLTLVLEPTGWQGQAQSVQGVDPGHGAVEWAGFKALPLAGTVPSPCGSKTLHRGIPASNMFPCWNEIKPWKAACHCLFLAMCSCGGTARSPWWCAERHELSRRVLSNMRSRHTGPWLASRALNQQFTRQECVLNGCFAWQGLVLHKFRI
jgi:hypothetical protein